MLLIEKIKDAWAAAPRVALGEASGQLRREMCQHLGGLQPARPLRRHLVNHWEHSPGLSSPLSAERAESMLSLSLMHISFCQGKPGAFIIQKMGKAALISLDWLSG